VRVCTYMPVQVCIIYQCCYAKSGENRCICTPIKVLYKHGQATTSLLPKYIEGLEGLGAGRRPAGGRGLFGLSATWVALAPPNGVPFAMGVVAKSGVVGPFPAA
jgi:hypothetical protein